LFFIKENDLLHHKNAMSIKINKYDAENNEAILINKNDRVLRNPLHNSYISMSL